MSCFFRCIYKVVGVTWLEDVKTKSPITVILYKCIKCREFKEENIYGKFKLEDLI